MEILAFANENDTDLLALEALFIKDLVSYLAVDFWLASYVRIVSIMVE